MTVLSSPFPGMDPYLEDPAEWQSVHFQLIARISDLLSEAVAPHYFVRVDQRVYVTTPGDLDRRTIEPDVYLLRQAPARYQTAVGTPGVTPFLLVEPAESDPEIRDRFIEIRDARNRAVVTTIEVLSPFNKRSGAQGFSAFQQKRENVMASQTHWIEIDLLRAGSRPQEVTDKGDYYALLKRGDRPRPYAVWFFNLQNRMPTMAVPLRPPHADVPLDLQAVWDELYRRARYAQSIDYSQPPPPPPLRPDDEGWAQARIQTWQTARQHSVEAARQ
ncbi:MAG: DUF4058 family protein [Chloroflexi bacterium]|nr:DUF4058 family protein [Chloroflexota bacterium]